jgi:hypothetical protein
LWKVGAYKQLSVKGEPIHEMLAPMNRLSLRNNWLKFETSGKSLTILEGFDGIYSNLIKGKLKDANIQPIGLGNTRILTGYAQNPPQILVGTHHVALFCNGHTNPFPIPPTPNAYSFRVP